jgi:hypothetical protein
MKKTDMLRIIFVFWPMGLVIGEAIYFFPRSLCAFPNATYLYNAAGCPAYNNDPLAGVNQILITAISVLAGFGWIAMIHSYLGDDFADVGSND